MSGNSNIEEQVAEFFAERGLLPIVPIEYWGGTRPKVHGAEPDEPLLPICRGSHRAGQMRPAEKSDLCAAPCRGCTRSYIVRTQRRHSS